jgi:hypothetical protein
MVIGVVGHINLNNIIRLAMSCMRRGANLYTHAGKKRQRITHCSLCYCARIIFRWAYLRNAEERPHKVALI